MPETVIQVDGLSKRYRIGLADEAPDSLVSALAGVVARPVRQFRRLRALSSFGRPERDSEDVIWALKDVSFEIKQGEVVGVIGLNGAGKSTLLRVLSRITEPTAGQAVTRGRVGSLLEVGTGFHPELTGRENTYLNGSVMGMSRSEIDRKFDQIVEFSGIEKFIDTPVKRYSNGMYVRLAFSVAAHLEPEILLVDEVLAVGDVQFQRRCLGKMDDVAKGGRTVLFVSHNMGNVSTLCEKAMLLEQGSVEFIGPTPEAVSRYLGVFDADTTTRREWPADEAPTGDHTSISRVTVTDASGAEKPWFSVTEPVIVTVDYRVAGDDVPVNIRVSLFDERANCICVVGNHRETERRPVDREGRYVSRCVIPGSLLNSGRHSISVQGVANQRDIDVDIQHCVDFGTVDDDRAISNYTRWAGIIKPEFEWETARLG